jgi:multidrug efflux pump subunit AcrB
MLKILIDRPITVTMGLLVIMVLGIVSIRQLPVSLIPEIDVPNITVQVSAPDMSSKEIDEAVLRPLRQNLMQISNLDEFKSEAKDGLGIISLSFTVGSDMDYAFIEVNEKIDRSMSALGDVERPKVYKSSASDIPAFYVNLTLKNQGTIPPDKDTELYPVSDAFSQLSTFASEVISKRIEQLPEVAMVDVSGCVEAELLIIPDEAALREAGMSLAEFESAIHAADVRLGSLAIRDGEYRYNVKFQSIASTKTDIENISLNCHDRIFKVRDLSQVIEHPAKRSGLVRSDGKDAISLAVIKQSDAKMSSLKSKMSELSEQLEKDYPQIDFKVMRDQTELLEYSINNLLQNIIVGIILACVIIFLFMQDFRSPALVALTIPTALIFSMLVFHVMGMTINIISLSGLILGVGMIVDNTIVLTDNITARWQRGDDLRTAVLSGTAEVRGPMLSSVLTTCAVFIPLIFVSGIAGAMFYDEAMSVTIILLTAYLVTIIVMPVYYWTWYKKLPAFKPNPLLSRFSLHGFMKLYENILTWLFRHRWAGWAIFGFSVVGIFLCFAFMERTKLPEISYSDTLVRVDWNAPLSLEQNTERVAALEGAVSDLAEQVTSMVGMQQFILSHDSENDVSGATMYLKCKDARTLGKMKDRIASELASRWPDAAFSFESSGNIFDMVFSEDEPELVARLRPVSVPWVEIGRLERLLAEIRIAEPDLEIPEPNLKRNILYVADPEKMALYGVTLNSLLVALKNCLNENELFTIVQGNRSLPVVMGVDRRGIKAMIEGNFIKAGDKEIPVSALMQQTWEQGLKSIVCGAEGVYYPLKLELEGKNAKETMQGISDVVRRNGDFEASYSGAYFSNNKMVEELALVLFIAVILLYLILASQFESLMQPFIILSEIIIDIFFSLLVLWICGVSINLMSMIGLVVVCGIVINDSILKIDTINKLRKDGMALEHSIYEAGHRRLKAIVMTSLTTILSVCPFLARGSMGDDLQFPMALVIIAGMTIGTLVSLFLVPVVYYDVYRKKKK